MRQVVSDWREMLAEQIEYRELLLQMIRRDLLIRYKEAVMGFGWAVFMPLVNTVVCSVIFTRVAPIETPVPYPIFAFCGLLAWNFFATSLRFAVISLTSNGLLVTKVYFPREILPLASIAVCGLDFLVGSLVLGGLMVYYGVAPQLSIAWLPLIVFVQVIFTAAVALAVSMANLFYRDVKYLFEVVITVWMFATPVVYPLQGIGGALGALLALNPMTPILDSYRNVLLLGMAPPPTLLWAGAVSLVALVCSWTVFHRAEFEFAERV